jgi:hypothetical protein
MEFMDRFEATLSAPVVDLASRLRGELVPVEQMESAGAISDFDEDWSGAEAALAEKASQARKAAGFRPYGESRDGRPWVVWAAVAVVLLACGAWFWLDRPVPGAFVQNSKSKAQGPVMSAKKSDGILFAKRLKTHSEMSPPVKPMVRSEDEKKMSAKPEFAGIIAASNPLQQASEAVTLKPSDEALAVKPEDPKVSEKHPVTIRKALLPTPEELEKMKQGRGQRNTGQLSDQNTASPIVQARN